MRNLSKSKLLVLVTGGLAASILLFWGVMWVYCRYFVNTNGSSMSLTTQQKQAALKSMTGVNNPEQLPFKTASGQKPLQPMLMNRAKHFTLIAEPIRWEYQKGKPIVTWALNGQVQARQSVSPRETRS